MRWFMIIFGIVALIAQAPRAMAMEPKVETYYKCVSDQAVRLSVGIDPANVIANSAAVMCGGELTKLGESNKPASANQLNSYEDFAISQATIAILEARAKSAKIR